MFRRLLKKLGLIQIEYVNIYPEQFAYPIDPGQTLEAKNVGVFTNNSKYIIYIYTKNVEGDSV